MGKIGNGILAGLVATIALSVLMVLKSMMGLMPQRDVISMLGGMMGAGAAMGWVAHFVIGTIVWGGAFALLYDHIPGGGAVIRGIVFGVAAWLLMMIVVMPMAGAGVFGMSLGIMAPIMTLVLHIIFGAVMGLVYDKRTHPHAASV